MSECENNTTSATFNISLSKTKLARLCSNLAPLSKAPLIGHEAMFAWAIANLTNSLALGCMLFGSLGCTDYRVSVSSQTIIVSHFILMYLKL